MKCGNCKAEIREGAVFCPKCGARLTVFAAKSAVNPADVKRKKSGRPAVLIAVCLAAAVSAAAVGFFLRGGIGDAEGAESGGSVMADAEAGTGRGNGDSTAAEGAAGSDGREAVNAGAGEESGKDVPAPESEARDMREELAELLEEEVRTLYEQRLLLHEAVRTIVAQEMENSSIVSVSPKEQFSVAEVLIDEATGNPIVSEGVKEFLRAAAEGKSVQDMCQSALAGSVSQLPDYLTGMAESSVQDAVTSVIGLDIFTPLSVISQWTNPEQEPTALLQGIVEEQQKDVGVLALFMQQEEISAADIYKIAQTVYAVEQRTQEISAARGGTREYTDGCAQLRRLAEQYAAAEARLSAYAEIQLPDRILEFDGEDRERVRQLQEQVGGGLEQYAALYSLSTFSIGNVSANYDVEGFREAQKTASQAGLLGNALFGDWVGGLMTESVQTYNGQIQENRRELCDLLTEFMEDSYAGVVTAQAAFMERYSILEHVSEASDNDLYLAALYLENCNWEMELEDAAREYMAALARYTSDLDSANILYNCILTPTQTNYLFDLQIEIDSLYQALGEIDSAWYEAGYSDDELLERWNRLVGCYVDSVEFLTERRATMGEAPGFYSNGSGRYEGAEYHVYTKEFAEISRPVLIIWGGTGYYYDMNGYLICMNSSTERVVGRGMHLLSCQFHTPGSGVKTVWADSDSQEIQRMYEYSQKAQELYSQFWKG